MKTKFTSKILTLLSVCFIVLVSSNYAFSYSLASSTATVDPPNRFGDLKNNISILAPQLVQRNRDVEILLDSISDKIDFNLFYNTDGTIKQEVAAYLQKELTSNKDITKEQLIYALENDYKPTVVPETNATTTKKSSNNSGTGGYTPPINSNETDASSYNTVTVKEILEKG